MNRGEFLVSEFSHTMDVMKKKPLGKSTLGELAEVIAKNTHDRENGIGRDAFRQEFQRRVKKISLMPLKNISLQDITIIVRTFEAMERTRHARLRTWFAGMTMLLGATGLFFLFLRVLITTR